MTAHAGTAESRRDELVERLFGAVLGMIDLHSVYLGDRLGLYRALAAGGATAGEVAAESGTNERYVREWLEQQAVTGLLEVDDASAEGAARRYRLPAGFQEVLLDPASLNGFAAFTRMMVGMVRPLPDVLEAFRSGGGVPYETYDEDFCAGQGDMNGAMFDALLGTEWLPSLPDVHARLLAAPPARVADVACGTGRSTLAIARSYPDAVVDGIDLDERSLELAEANLAAEPELADRVTFHRRDASDPGLAGRYDLVTIFEAVHDLSAPVEVLRAVRGLLAEGGSVLIADERVAEEFTAPGDEVERLMYGFSILHCLPVGMAEEPSAATGTALRPAKLREYALEAGFSSMEITQIENDFWRFYRLSP